MSDKIELHVERDGWTFIVTRKEDGSIIFTVGYRMYFVRDWRIGFDSPAKKQLLANLEEALGLSKRKFGRTIVQMNDDANGPVRWEAYIDDENPEFPYSVTIFVLTQDGTFSQLNGGDIPLTKEEVETLRQIFS